MNSEMFSTASSLPPCNKCTLQPVRDESIQSDCYEDGSPIDSLQPELGQLEQVERVIDGAQDDSTKHGSHDSSRSAEDIHTSNYHSCDNLQFKSRCCRSIHRRKACCPEHPRK